MLIRMTAEFERYEPGRSYDLPEEEALRVVKMGAAEIIQIETAALAGGKLRECRNSNRR